MVGGLLESTCSDNAAASYFAGYIARRILVKHSQLLKRNYQDCIDCEEIVTEKNIMTHPFVSFKEYSESVNIEWGLLYCTEKIIETIISSEKIFLYCMHNFPHARGFPQIVSNAITMNVTIPKFCNSSLTDFFVDLFVRCRIYHSMNYVNSKFRKGSQSEKLKKLTHV